MQEHLKSDIKFLTTFFHSEKELWQGSAGYNRSVPVMANIKGHLIRPGTDVEEYVDVTVIFEQFVEVEPSPFLFNPPADIW